MGRLQSTESILKKANTGREPDALLDLESSVRFLGIQNVRVQLIAEKLAEVFESPLLERNPQTQDLATPPPLLLKYAVKAIQHFGEDTPYKDLSFTSGLIFDILSLINSQNNDAAVKKKLEAFIEESFTQGLAIATAALTLGKSRKKLVLGHHVVSVVMINQASYVGMTLMINDYFDHLLKLRQGGTSLSVQNIAADHQFLGSHLYFSSIIAWPFPIFTGLELALINSDTPHLLSEPDEMNYYDVAALSFLASYLVQNQAQFKAGTLLQAKKLRPELKKFDLDFDVGNIFKKQGG